MTSLRLQLAAAITKASLPKFQSIVEDNEIDVRTYQVRGTSLLQWTCVSATPKSVLSIVQYLVEHGAEANTKEALGSTPLHGACQLGKCDLVRYLVEICGVDVNAKDNFGLTPLHRACLRRDADTTNCLDIIDCLVQNGAEVSYRDAKGFTPLWHACYSRKTEVAESLLKYKANIEEIDLDDGRNSNPLMMNIQWNNRDMVRLLVKHGADIQEALLYAVKEANNLDSLDSIFEIVRLRPEIWPYLRRVFDPLEAGKQVQKRQRLAT